MKKWILIFALAGALVPQLGLAGGPATGGASEWTQIANNLQLVNQYAKQVEQHIMQAKQLEAQLKNLMKNSSSSANPNVDGLISQIGGLMSAANSIGGTMAQIDAKFAKQYKSTEAQSLSDKFTSLNKTSLDTLEGSMKSAGLHRQNYASDSAAISALYSESQSAEGNLQALQTLSKINIAQVQQSQKLGDLLATQNIATSNYMASQTAKDQSAVDLNKYMTMPNTSGTIGKSKY